MALCYSQEKPEIADETSKHIETNLYDNNRNVIRQSII